MAIKPVIVGVDGSEESLLAVEWAALEARRYSAPLRIVSAPAAMPRMHAYHASPAEIAAALRGISARALATAITRAEEVAPGRPVETGLLTGPPAVAVADCGAGASILVVGARGAGGFAAMMLGSVSRYVAAWASCPVIVVREETTVVHREIAVAFGIRRMSPARLPSPSRRRRAAARTWWPCTPGTCFPPVHQPLARPGCYGYQTRRRSPPRPAVT
jgi:nucleotide-binding universal stress UspA family protein